MSDKPERQYLEDAPAEVQDLIYDGRKIQAIKLVRERMGLGLKEAKEKVDALGGRMREQFPDAPFQASQNAGCGTAMVMFALVVAVCAIVMLRMV